MLPPAGPGGSYQLAAHATFELAGSVASFNSSSFIVRLAALGEIEGIAPSDVSLSVAAASIRGTGCRLPRTAASWVLPTRALMALVVFFFSVIVLSLFVGVLAERYARPRTFLSHTQHRTIAVFFDEHLCTQPGTVDRGACTKSWRLLLWLLVSALPSCHRRAWWCAQDTTSSPNA